jgi:hypothetical protein
VGLEAGAQAKTTDTTTADTATAAATVHPVPIQKKVFSETFELAVTDETQICVRCIRTRKQNPSSKQYDKDRAARSHMPKHLRPEKKLLVLIIFQNWPSNLSYDLKTMFS